MKNLFLLWLLLTASCVLAQERMPLPVVKGGRWFLMAGQNEIVLPETYSAVGLFDKKGTASFIESGKYGVLDIAGKEILPARYFSVSSMGNGFYHCTSEAGSEILKAYAPENQPILSDTFKLIQPSWLYFEKDSIRYLLNTDTQKQFVLKKGEFIKEKQFDYLLITSSNSLQSKLLGPKGEIVSEDSGVFQGTGYFFHYQTAKLNVGVDARGTIPLPAQAQNISVTNETFHYSINGKVYLCDRETRKVIVSSAGESIAVYDRDHYQITRNELIGIVDKNGRTVIPAEYDFIGRRSAYIVVEKNTLEGLLDSNFRTVLSCRYSYIRWDQHFFHTSLGVGGKGLVSRMTNEELLRPVYDRIEINKNMIKAWRNGNLSIVELTENHHVKNKLILDNTISLISKTVSKGSSGVRIDSRLFPLGWYYDTISSFDSKGTATLNYLWGLKNASDSILIQPKLKNMLYIEGAPVTLTSPRNEKIGLVLSDPEPSSGKTTRIWKMVSHQTGKFSPLQVIDLDSTDFRSRGYARCTHMGGEGILLSDGSFREMTYIDRSEEKLLRVCVKGQETLLVSPSEESVKIYPRAFNPMVYPITIQRGSDYFSHYEFKNAQWNFLNADGDLIFRDTFVYVQPFYKQAAIVKSIKGWGIVNADSVIVQPVYEEIKRIPVYADSVFLVKKASGGKVFFDTLFQPLDLGKLEKFKDKLSVYNSGGKMKVLSEDYKVIAEGNKSFSLYDFNRFSTKTKKVHEIFDIHGKSVGETEAKPHHFLDEDHFVSNSSGKSGLMLVTGDTLIPFVYSRIIKAGAYFLAEGKAVSDLYSPDGKLFKSVRNAQLLMDTLTGNWVEIADGNAVFYNPAGQKQGKVKSELHFQQFFNGCLFSEQGNYTILGMDGKKVLPGKAFSEVQFFPEGYCALKDLDRKWHVYDRNWKEQAAEVKGKTKIKWLDDGVMSFRLRSETVLFDVNDESVHTGYSRIKGNWNDGFLLVSLIGKGSRWCFVNRRFEQPFHRDFSDATPFSNGYACVAEQTGWTILGTDGLVKSLPSYARLEQAGHHLFQMSLPPTYGLVDSRGKYLLEPVYEKISILPDNLIQVIKDGQIGYFDYTGNVICPIQ